MENVKSIMETLENISNTNYEDFEIALLLFLRSDTSILEDNNINNIIDNLKDLIQDYDSLLDIDKWEIDSVLESEEN